MLLTAYQLRLTHITSHSFSSKQGLYVNTLKSNRLSYRFYLPCFQSVDHARLQLYGEACKLIGENTLTKVISFSLPTLAEQQQQQQWPPQQLVNQKKYNNIKSRGLICCCYCPYIAVVKLYRELHTSLCLQEAAVCISWDHQCTWLYSWYGAIVSRLLPVFSAAWNDA